MRLRTITAASMTALLVLSACSSNSSSTSSNASSGSANGYDVSKVKKVDEIAALVPAEIASSGKLVIGASIDYAPAEFRAEDLTTAIGYDVDLGKAIGKVLGLEAEVVDGEFASLLPAVGSKYNIGISSFTIRPDRIEQANMVSYINVGSSFAVPAGNPDSFNPDSLCGTTIAVQTGTDQEKQLKTFSEECTSAGNKAIEMLSYARQSEATTNVVGKKAQAFYADSSVAGYASKLTNGQLEVVGGVRDAAPQGIVIAKNDPKLAEAIQKAVQHLMDDGTWPAIVETWGVSKDAALTTAKLNPTS